jgi:hypothetical protein
VVAVIGGVVKLVPDPSNVPPLKASYQSIVVPAVLVADKLTVPEPHLEPFTGLVGAAGLGFTITLAVVVFVQLPAAAVIVKVVDCCEVVLLVSIPVIDVPVPVAGMPVRLAVLVLAQLKVVPATLFGLLMSIWVIFVAVQIV